MYPAIKQLAVALVLSLSLSFAVQAEETKPVADPARLAAAHELLEVTGVTKQMDMMAEQMSKGFATGSQAENNEVGKKLSAEFDANMKKLLEYKDQMIADLAALYAEVFTAEEMKAVSDFYRSGPGAKFIAKTPELMQRGADIGIRYSQKIMEDLKAQKK